MSYERQLASGLALAESPQAESTAQRGRLAPAPPCKKITAPAVAAGRYRLSPMLQVSTAVLGREADRLMMCSAPDIQVLK